MDYRIEYTLPPIDMYKKVVDRFRVDWHKGVILTYGDIIYTKFELPNDLLKHEETHVRQQMAYKGGKDAWFERYLADDQFRLDNELEAYRRQYRYAKENIKDRNQVFNILRHSAKDLSMMYDLQIDFNLALELIQK